MKLTFFLVPIRWIFLPQTFNLDEPSQAGEKSKLVKHDIVMKPDSVKKQSGFFKSNKSRYPMYPCHEEKIKYDEYGEIIRSDL